MDSRISKYLRNEDLILLRMEELTDFHTYKHSVRVGFMVENLIKIMNDQKCLEEYGKKEIRHIIRGAFLHDCGKTLNTINVQQLPRKLENTEFEIIKMHPIIGSTFIGFFPEIIQNIVKYHHSLPKDRENTYPKYDLPEIKKYIELVSLVDKFEAITSDRPYHSGKSYEETLDFLSELNFWGFKTLRENYKEIVNSTNKKTYNIDA